MPWLTWVFLVLGVVGVIAGLRGRVVARELHCKACNYPLSGAHHTPQSVCPECGHNIWVGVVVRLRRIRRKWLLRFAYVLFLLALMSASIPLFGRVTGINWNRFRSVESLKDDISETNPTDDRAAAWRELSRRSVKGLLSTEDVCDVAAIAVDRHLQLLRIPNSGHSHGPVGLSEILATWQPVPQWEHSRWIQMAWKNRLLTSVQLSAYVQTMFEPQVDAHVQPTVVNGQPCLVTLVMHGRGLGGFESIEVAATIVSSSLDGRPVDLQVNDWYMPVQLMSGSRDAPIQAASQTAINLRASPGEYELLLQIRYGIVFMSIGQGRHSFDLGGRVSELELWPPTITESTTRVRATVKVFDGRNE